MNESSLQKLTLVQLKALCKEKKITGYSKLKKELLIQKIASSIPKDSLPDVDPKTNPHVKSPQFHENDPSEGQSGLILVHPKTQAAHQVLDTQTRLTTKRPISPSFEQPSKKGKIRKSIHLQSESPIAPSIPKLSMKDKDTGSDSPLSPLLVAKDTCPPSAKSPSATTSRSSHQITPSITLDIPTPNRLQSVPKPPGVKFQPLVPTRDINILSRGPPPAKQPLFTVLRSPKYLDFDAFNFPDLKAILLPPRLKERRLMPRLSLVLSQVSPESLVRVALVSRSWRYAAYLSAIYRLERNFPGKRTSQVLESHKTNTTDFWPYLRARELEYQTAVKVYESSFVYQLLPSSTPISNALFRNPDNNEQIVVALRFLLSAIFFSLSLSGYTHPIFPGIIVDVQEVVSGAIWSVTIQTESLETVYVLGNTGEVLGRREPQDGETSFPARADWSSFIMTHIHNVDSTKPSQIPSLLFRYLKWPNHEEYQFGMSRLWLKRMGKEGEYGVYKRVIAERYVLACVVGNSLSGRWMSSSEMEQDFSGMGSMGATTWCVKKARTMPVSLFLPSHHFVESLHLTASNGTLLHPALAVVQTPAREYYILRDNGMQVGCEEEGVAEIWCTIIGCDRLGVSVIS